MQRPTRIFYVGTYERDYPRNALVRAALGRAGFSVQELHHTVWSSGGDKTALLGSRSALLRHALRLGSGYIRLLTGVMTRRNDVDVAMFGFIGQLDLLVLGPLLRALKKPIVFDPLVTLTDTLVEDRAKVAKRGIWARGIRLADQLAFRLVDVILADTDENRSYICSNFGVPIDRVLVVPVGADETMFRPEVVESVSTDCCDDRGPLRVLFYGTMIPLQGVETIVRAAKLLEDEAVEINVIGAGQTLAAVQRLAGELRVRNVIFMPRVPYEELPSWIARADVVLGIFGASAKAARVVPNKVYQAMSMGAAIVTRDSPAMHKLLSDGESGMLVPPADPGALADAIRALHDSNLRLRLGQTARRRFIETSTLDVQSDLVRDAIELATAGAIAGNRAVTV